ncbi:MAG: ATP-binding domain-containing protein, partial [Myxococcota bacterium]|nr:ATP-binding domain-containing protein [Myxococcota bacterium]
NPDGPSLSRGNRTFRVGDRVIQVKNDYDHDIFNGDTGRVVTAGSGGLIVDFDGRQVALTGESLDVIEPAWAISIHKSQGSEYRAVVVVLHRAHRIMLRRNLLYTAMTRAREFCCVVADPWALQTAVRTAGGMARWTRLADRLRET